MISIEAEYMRLVSATGDLMWIRSLFSELNINFKSPDMLWFDNQSATALASNSVLRAKVKHIEIDFYFFREKVKKSLMSVQYVPIGDQLTDILTKPLPMFLLLEKKFLVVPIDQFQGGRVDEGK